MNVSPEPDAIGPGAPPDDAAPEPTSVLRTASYAALGLGAAVAVVAARAARTAVEVASEMADAAPGAEALREMLEPWAERGQADAGTMSDAFLRLVGAIADEVVGAVDIDGIVNRLDLDAIVATVDIDQIAKRLEVTDLVFHTTGGIAGDAVDFVRGRGVAMDRLVVGIVDRVLRRDASVSEEVIVVERRADEPQ
jgi:hypothetical protein